MRERSAPIAGICGFCVLWGALGGLGTDPDDPTAGAHGLYAEILEGYAAGDRFRYRELENDREDRDRLTAFVDRLESMDPALFDTGDERLAFWINLYNAATIELVVSHFPIASIREIGGPDGSPWKRNVVRVGDDSLSLDAIEHDRIRASFDDARVHFALNCASIGCPPLLDRPFRAATLDSLLDASTRRALSDPRWCRVEGDTVALTPIFDWFASDFVRDAGSVAAFLDRHGAVEASRHAAAGRVRYAAYDWTLNSAR